MDAPINHPPFNDLLQRQRGARNRPDLSSDDRTAIIQMIMMDASMVNGEMVPAWGSISRTANFFNVNKATISRVWKTASENARNMGVYKQESMRKNCGKTQQIDRELLQMEVATIPREQRKTMQSLAVKVGISTTTIHRFVHDGTLEPVTIGVKPILADENMHLSSTICKRSCSIKHGWNILQLFLSGIQ